MTFLSISWNLDNQCSSDLKPLKEIELQHTVWLKSFELVVRDPKISGPAEIFRSVHPPCHTFLMTFKKLNTQKRRKFDSEWNGLHIMFPIKTFLGTSYKKPENLSCPKIQDYSNNNSTFQAWKHTAQSLKPFVQHRVIHAIESMLHLGMRFCSATPLHASCPKHSTHFLVKIRGTLYEKKSQNLSFYLIYNSRFLLLWRAMCHCRRLENLSCSRKL